MVVEPLRVDATAREVPQLSRTYTSGETYHEWLKPFGAEWTLRGIVQAKTESEARAILKNWIHKARAEEVVDDMIEECEKRCALMHFGGSKNYDNQGDTSAR